MKLIWSRGRISEILLLSSCVTFADARESCTQVDEEEELSTSPYTGTKGQTWQQAVQYVEEIRVEVDDNLPLLAKHDTYGITFKVRLVLELSSRINLS